MTDVTIDVPVVQGPPGPIDLLVSFRDVTANYTLIADDLGRMVRVNSATPATVTLPATLPAGWICHVRQDGAGSVTLQHATGGAVNRIQAGLTILVRWGIVTIVVDRNSNGASAEYYLYGSLT